MKDRITRFLLTFTSFVLLFAIQRSLFFAYYHDLFDGAGISGILAAMWHGLPLDLSLAGYLTAVPGLLLTASIWTSSKILKAAGKSYFLLVSIIMAAVFVVDLCLYGFWGFRLDATPVFYFFTSPADTLASVSTLYAIIGVSCMLVYAALLFLAFRRMLSGKLREVRPLRKRWTSSAAMLLLTASLFIPIRGSLTTSTMNLSVAYFSQNQRLNHAAINPMFSFMYSALHQTDFDKQFRYMDVKTADKLFAGLADKPVAAPDSVPQLFTVKRPNVIIIILESFSNHLLPSLGGEDIAPNLDKIAGEGILFTNFFSNSFRTDRGLVSIISGYPAQPNTSIMKFAEKVEHLPSVPRSLKQAGYDPAYYYGGDANFTNMNAYLVSAGFDRIISDKDFPLSERTGKWGAHDHLVFDKLLADLRTEKSDAPLLRILQTSSSHEPFEVPFCKYGDKAKNAFAYTDDCVGKFIGALKAMPMWKNTVVILVPDHQGGYPARVENPVERHRIPLVITGGAVNGAGRIDTYASQIDLAATLLHQLGLPHGEFTFSKNVLNPASPHFAYFTEPSLFGMVIPENSLVFNCDANTVIANEGTQKGANLEPGKAFLQKLYDDLSKR